MSNISLKSRVKSDRIFLVWAIIILIGLAIAEAYNTPQPVIQQQEYSFKQELNLEE